MDQSTQMGGMLERGTPATLSVSTTGALDPRDAPPEVPALCEEFDITAAEARVLIALMAGELPKHYALRRGLSMHTVRSQIAALMWKMQCRRQLELVRKGMLYAMRLESHSDDRKLQRTSIQHRVDRSRRCEANNTMVWVGAGGNS